MNNVTGYVYFENKALDDIKSIQEKAETLKGLNSKLFKQVNLKGNQTLINAPGVFFIGETSQTESQIIKNLRQQVGLNQEILNCDVSVQGEEDYVEHMRIGDLAGNYIGVKLMPEYNLWEISKITEILGTILDASNLGIRTAEPFIAGNPTSKPKICMDFVTSFGYEESKESFEKTIRKYGLNLCHYTHIEFEKQ